MSVDTKLGFQEKTKEETNLPLPFPLPSVLVILF